MTLDELITALRQIRETLAGTTPVIVRDADTDWAHLLKRVGFFEGGPVALYNEYHHARDPTEPLLPDGERYDADTWDLATWVTGQGALDE